MVSQSPRLPVSVYMCDHKLVLCVDQHIRSESENIDEGGVVLLPPRPLPPSHAALAVHT